MGLKFFRVLLPIIVLIFVTSFVMTSSAQKTEKIKQQTQSADLKKSDQSKPGSIKESSPARVAQNNIKKTETAKKDEQAEGSKKNLDQNKILLNSGHIDTRTPEMQASRGSKTDFGGKGLHLVQFSGPTQDEWYEQLSRTGVRIVSYIPHYAYLVYGDPSAVSTVQSLSHSKNFIQWEGPFLNEYKIHRHALPVDEKGTPRKLPSDIYSIQLVEDAEVNSLTVSTIEKLKLEDIYSYSNDLGYVNIKVRLNPESVFEIAKQPDVVSIQLAPDMKLNDERQAIILTGNLSGNNPGPADYLSWLSSKGFTQAQFTASGFGVDVTDDGVDNGTATPTNPALFQLGNTSNPDRVAYVRRESNIGFGEIRGCFGHGNLNAHIIAGYNDLTGFPHEDASSYNYNLGIAPFVRVGASVIFTGTFSFPDYEDLQSRAYNDGMRISNNSWGQSTPNGAYNSDSQRYDALVRDAQPTGAAIAVAGNQEMVIVFSAGNAGPVANTVGAPSTGKNVISVGAAENVHPFGAADGCGADDTFADNANDVASFSSRGPTDDGRTKPDIMAPGTHVTGGVFQTSPLTFPNGNDNACFDASSVCAGTAGSEFFPAGQEWTTASTGTSHSAPAVAGGAALLRQYFINNGSTPPSPAMTKAYLTNASRYLTGAGGNDTLPSNTQGTGEMDLGLSFDGTARILRDQLPADEFDNSGQNRTLTGVIADPTKPFRVSLAWTDAPGPTSGNAFVNNLDLSITLGGNTYRGNVFLGANSIPGGAADLNDNLESIFLPAGTTGSFTININATNIAGNGVPGDADGTDQDFALVCYNCVEVAAPVILDGATTITDENCVPFNGMIDPGETVSMGFELQNVGTADTTNLVATLLETGGITSPSGPQSYGALIAGGPADSREFTFTSNGVCGENLVATFSLQDGATDLGTVSFNLSTGVPGSVTSFSNPTTINIPDVAIGNPFPSTINVSGMTSGVAKVTVQLNGFTHTFPDDVDVMLVGPQGQKVMLMGEAGGGGNANLANLTFDDAAALAIPDSTLLTTGTFRPADYLAGDTIQAPAPPPPYATTLSEFNGTDPNGDWNLYVRDDGSSDVGSIATGWTLNITGSDCCTNICPEITMSPSTLPDGILGATYDQTISGNNGVEPYTFALIDGALPDGLSLNPNTGQIVGPATALGTFNFTIEATDANGCSGTQDFSIAVVCPEITLDPATLSDGVVGTSYDQTVSGVGGAAPYTFAVTDGSLPTGLTLDTNTGQISGTPSASGTFGFDITATDANNCTGVNTYSVTIACPAITVNPGTLPGGTIGVSYSETVSAVGGTTPHTFAVTSGSLPTGLNLDSNTGLISGTPTALGTFNFDITATDSFGCTGITSYSVTISCPVITVNPGTLPGGTVGTLYDETVSGSGGTAPYTFAVTSGTLPDGLTLNSSTGQITGTPSAAGTFNFDVTATDANACTGVTSYSITMTCPAITVNPATLPDGTIGVSYDETVSGSGGTAPYTFAVTSGTLPDGLTLDSNTGQISGTATALGTFNFDITATDNFGCTGTTSYTVNINCPEVTVLPATLPNGTVGTAYDQTVSGNGGAEPYTFAVTSGSLPDGLTLDSNTGQISGTPSAAGTFNFDITATDANGCTGVTSYSITMGCPAITVNPSTLPNGTMGTLYDQTVSGSGGTAPYTFAVTSGSLPTGLTLDANTGQITGTPTALGPFNFDITATDNFGCTGTTSYTVTIDCPAITVLPGTLPNGIVGALYDQTVSGSGGTAPYTFAVTSGTLPTGLTLNANTGQITGIPSASGTFNFDITATDANNCAGVTSYSISMVCPVITLNPATLPDGSVGVLYDQTVSGIGGTAPYAYTVSSGTLPDGLTLNPITGQITGTPTTLGTSNFMITATDSFGCAGTVSYSITINCPVITVLPATLPNGTVGSLYDQTVSGSGGTAPYTFAVTSGSLPTGLTLDANTGQITGTPTIEGSFNFDITATDANNCTGTTSYSVDSECLFCDEFNDSTVDPDWTYIKTITKWSEDGNALSGSSTKKIQAFAIPAFGGCTTCYAETVMRSSGNGYVWFLFHVQDKNNMVELLMREQTNSWVLKHRVNKRVIAKQKFVLNIDPDTDYTVRIRYDGTNYIASVGGVDIITLAPGAAVNGGSIGYKLRRGTGTFQRIEVN